MISRVPIHSMSMSHGNSPHVITYFWLINSQCLHLSLLVYVLHIFNSWSFPLQCETNLSFLDRCFSSLRQWKTHKIFLDWALPLSGLYFPSSWRRLLDACMVRNESPGTLSFLSRLRSIFKRSASTL